MRKRKAKVKTHHIQAAENSKARLAAKKARDDAYRAALGLKKGDKLPKTIGAVASAGGGRDRRGWVRAGIGDPPDQRRGAATRNRARLLG